MLSVATSKHLTPIKPIPAYELVARQIQRAVHMGLLVPGDRLPAERDLAEQLGVARMTVREAIRVLAHQGQITVKRGVQGGMWIRTQEVTAGELVRLAADVDRAVDDVYKFREIVERASARLAAERAKAKDVQKLSKLCRSMQEILAAHAKHPISSHVPRFLALDSQFHTEIGSLSGNQFIADSVEQALAARYAPFGAVFRALTRDANDGHDELVEAIAAHDGARAEGIMSKHIREAHDSLRSILNRQIKANSR